MQPSSFEFVPQGDIPSFTSQQPLQNISPVVSPEVPQARPIHEIANRFISDNSIQGSEQQPVSEEKKKRLYVPASKRQREILIEEYSKHGIRKPMKYCEEKTRICGRTLRPLIKDIQSGKDVSVPGKRGRRPNSPPSSSRRSHLSCVFKIKPCEKRGRRPSKTSCRLSGLATNPCQPFPSQQ